MLIKPTTHLYVSANENVCKRFPGVLANCEVDFDVVSGEIHALLGENGAGKSTLMKVLYGMYKLDDGEIILNGQPVTIQNPTVAINHGIGMILALYVGFRR